MSARPLAVVTGASSGIGYELARELATRGHDLVVTAENDEIDQTAGPLERLGAEVTATRADLRRPDEVDRFAELVVATGRPVDVLAVNAGVGVGGSFVTGTVLADQLAMVDLNVRSSVHLAKVLLPAMVDRGRGRVLFTSSVAATLPSGFPAVHHASMAFLRSFAQSLREELKTSGVSVTALLPGPTATRFFERAGMTDTNVGAGPKDDAADVAREAVAALLAGRDHVVAGSLRNKVQAAATRVLPSRLLTAVSRKASARS